MGLSIGLVDLLIGMHARHRFQSPVLSLGVLDVYATYDQVIEFLGRHQLPAHLVPPQDRPVHRSIAMPSLGFDPSLYVHCDTLFRLLGLPGCDTLDGSPAEGPTIVHDLNTPIDPRYHGRYGLVVDSGTLEHIFDVRTAMSNLVRLVQLGGLILHASPMSGWVNHGFFQISPCLFYDFYQANGFSVREAYIVDGSPGPTRAGLCVPYTHTRSRLRIKFPGEDSNNREVYLVFLAQKQTACETIQVPTQGKYQPRFQAVPALRPPTATGAGLTS